MDLDLRGRCSKWEMLTLGARIYAQRSIRQLDLCAVGGDVPHLLRLAGACLTVKRKESACAIEERNSAALDEKARTQRCWHQQSGR
jgi:hypothetical protein